MLNSLSPKIHTRAKRNRNLLQHGHVLQLLSRSRRRRHCESQHKFIPSTQLQNNNSLLPNHRWAGYASFPQLILIHSHSIGPIHGSKFRPQKYAEGLFSVLFYFHSRSDTTVPNTPTVHNTSALERREEVEIRTFFTPGHVLQLPSRSGRRRHCESQHKFIPSTQLQKKRALAKPRWAGYVSC